jgi:hypothetical protein
MDIFWLLLPSAFLFRVRTWATSFFSAAAKSSTWSSGQAVRDWIADSSSAGLGDLYGEPSKPEIEQIKYEALGLSELSS